MHALVCMIAVYQMFISHGQMSNRLLGIFLEKFTTHYFLIHTSAIVGSTRRAFQYPDTVDASHFVTWSFRHNPQSLRGSIITQLALPLSVNFPSYLIVMLV